MAEIVKITPTNIEKVNFGEVDSTKQKVNFVTPTAVESSDKLYDSTKTYAVRFQANEKDQKYVILVQNTNASDAKSAYVVAGDDPTWGGLGDLKVEVAKSSIVAINVESAAYKQMTNDKGHKEEILIKSDSTDIKVAVVKLP